MGTRSLGDRPWLSGDQSTLGLRVELLNDRLDDGCAAPSSAEAAIVELAEMVAAACGLDPPEISAGIDGLVWLGQTVVEDFCLLRRGDVEWELEAAVLCFPSRWRLADKLGRPLREVHAPVDGYDRVLADRVTSLLDRLGERTVMRRNWFVHPNGALFQPDRPADGDPFVPQAEVADGLFVRSERQTLRALPRTRRVVFAITTQQCSLGEFAADPVRRDRFLRYLRHAPTDQVEHRGMAAAQVAAVVSAFG